MGLALQQGDMQPIEYALGHVPAGRQVLRVKIFQTFLAAVDLFAEESAPAGQEPQLQAIAALSACAPCCCCGDQSNNGEGDWQNPECQKVASCVS